MTTLATLSVVMPGVMPGIHVFLSKEDVDGRHKAGHDGVFISTSQF